VPRTKVDRRLIQPKHNDRDFQSTYRGDGKSFDLALNGYNEISPRLKIPQLGNKADLFLWIWLTVFSENARAQSRVAGIVCSD